MTESLMTEAATTTEGSPESSSVASEALTNVEQAADKQQSTETQNQVSDQKGDETGNSEGEQAAKQAPEKYEFKAPEGVTYDSDVIDTYAEVAKELNLSQDDAQKMLERLAPKIAERQAAQIDSIRNEWADNARTDKEYGGEKLQENLSVAKKALDAFGTPELRSLLNESGLGNNPEVIRFMYRAGKSLSEEKFVGNSTGAGVKAGGPRSFSDQATALYSNQS